jgi:hypothetical protein
MIASMKQQVMMFAAEDQCTKPLADLRSSVSQGAENVGGELLAMIEDQQRISAMISMIVCHQ